MTDDSGRHVRPPARGRSQARFGRNQPTFGSYAVRASAPGVLLLLLCGTAAAQGDSPTQLRRFIDQQVGGIDKLKVPATDAGIPLPRQKDGTVNLRCKTTEQKRYLGKLLHDPVRTARIDPAYGGVLATAQSASCGSCHPGEAAGKAGAQFNFAVGGEGRGYTDEKGDLVVRRRPRSDLPILGKHHCSPEMPLWTSYRR